MQYPQYDRASNNSPLSDIELQAFDELLAELPANGAMNIEGVDGYLTGLLLGPHDILDQWPTGDWLPLVWGGDGPQGEPFASNRQRKRATLFVLRHLQAVACQLRDHPRQWEPLFSVVEANGEEWVDAQDWCTGFLQAIDLAPEAWREWQVDTELGPALATIALLGDDEVGQGDEAEQGEEAGDVEEPVDPVARDAMARAVVAGVLAMHERRQP
ncbi:MAG TPA: UPF0149 family protein [Ideonella sp.]|jgi:uncharacterized protein|nr:UPF0149 family protein [Ideonella sp.]